MKKIFTTFALVGTVVLAAAQTISFDKTTWDYGTVKTGADGHRVFVVKNTGDKPLILSNVKASCGCTTPEFSQAPIMPGKSAEIKVGYNTGINGVFTKQIEVFSNDPQNSRTVLFIKGTVDPKAAEAKPLTAEEQKKAAELKAKEEKAKAKEAKKEAKKARHAAKAA